MAAWDTHRRTGGRFRSVRGGASGAISRDTSNSPGKTTTAALMNQAGVPADPSQPRQARVGASSNGAVSTRIRDAKRRRRALSAFRPALQAAAHRGVVSAPQAYREIHASSGRGGAWNTAKACCRAVPRKRSSAPMPAGCAGPPAGRAAVRQVTHLTGERPSPRRGCAPGPPWQGRRHPASSKPHARANSRISADVKSPAHRPHELDGVALAHDAGPHA